MAFPDDLTTVTVTHTIADPARRPLPGVVVATPTGRQWKQGEGSILPAEYTAPIEDGTWTLELPAVDQFVNLEAYRIEERPTTGGKPWGRAYHIAPTLEHAGEEPVDATDVITTPPRGGDIVFTAGPATDSSMAQVAADPNSEFGTQLKSTIATGVDEAVPPAVGDALRNDETIGPIIEQAVEDAADGLDLVTQPYARDHLAAKDALPGSVEIPLDLPTYDGNPNTTHPGVLYIPEGFGPQGHRYWMVHTPYPNDLRENPSVVSSPDGVRWTVPPGAPDPVVPYSEIQADGYYFNSDPDLLRLADGRLAMYYRPVQSAAPRKIALMRKTTTDGVSWSDAETVLGGPYESGEVPYRSPGFIREDDGTVTMYTVTQTAGTEAIVRWTSADDGASFTQAETCVVPILGHRIDHLDIEYVGGRYWLLVTRRVFWDLQLLVSDDGVTFTHVQTIGKSGSVWDGFGHYRASLVPVAGPGVTFDIYTGSIDSTGSTPVPDGTGANAPMDAQWRILLLRGVTPNDTGHVTGGDASDETAVAIHPTASASGVETVAIGGTATATPGTSTGAVSIGYSTAAASGATAIGRGASASATKTVAIGSGATSAHASVVAIGPDTTATGSSAVSVGSRSTGAANDTVIGTEAKSTAGSSVSIGYLANVSAQLAIAIGRQASATAMGAVSVGRAASASVGNATALGRDANASHSGSVALGQGTQTTAADQVAVGARDVEIQDATKGVVLHSPNGTRYRLTVADDGTLGTTAV